MFATFLAYEANAAVGSEAFLLGTGTSDYAPVLALNDSAATKLMQTDTPTTITRSCMDSSGTDPILIPTGNTVDDMSKIIIDTWTFSLVDDANKWTGQCDVCSDSTDAG